METNLAEASRIPVKHLLTLQSSISNEQTSEMKRQNVQLIVPANLHVSYTDLQRQWLWTLQDFITFVLDKQKK